MFDRPCHRWTLARCRASCRKISSDLGCSVGVATSWQVLFCNCALTRQQDDGGENDAMTKRSAGVSRDSALSGRPSAFSCRNRPGMMILLIHPTISQTHRQIMVTSSSHFSRVVFNSLKITFSGRLCTGFSSALWDMQALFRIIILDLKSHGHTLVRWLFVSGYTWCGRWVSYLFYGHPVLMPLDFTHVYDTRTHHERYIRILLGYAYTFVSWEYSFYIHLGCCLQLYRMSVIELYYPSFRG